MSDNSQSELSYQPATKAYSFSAAPTPPAGGPAEPKKKTNIFVLLFFEILGLIAVFVVFLLILNYFKIISLSNLLPNQLVNALQTNQSSAPTLDSKTGLWTAKGTFYGYNQYIIKIRINGQVMDFQWASDTNGALLYQSAKNLSDPNYSPAPYTLYDVEQSQTLGKAVIVQYKIVNGQKIIDNLKIFTL